MSSLEKPKLPQSNTLAYRDENETAKSVSEKHRFMNKKVNNH